MKLKRSTYGFLFSEITTKDKDKGVQINEKIFTDNNYQLLKVKGRSGNICTQLISTSSSTTFIHSDITFTINVDYPWILSPLMVLFWVCSSSLSITTLILLSLFPVPACLPALLSSSVWAILSLGVLVLFLVILSIIHYGLSWSFNYYLSTDGSEFCTVDPWTTCVWIVQVHLYVNFFQ